MLFRWLKGDAPRASERPSASEELRQQVARAMPDATHESAALVAALAGAFAYVAYADRRYHDEEARAVREALARVHDLPAQAADAVAALLGARIEALSAEPLQSHTRVLVALTEPAARLELLEVLVELAVADEVLSMDETNALRRVAKLLGLSDDAYLAVQAHHRARLSVLR